MRRAKQPYMMGSYLVGIDAEPYSFPCMKQQVQKQFGDKIIITEVNSKQNVVSFWSTVQSIISEFYSDDSQLLSFEEQKSKIMQTAAKLITSIMKSLIQQKDHYPKYNEMVSMDEVNHSCQNHRGSFSKVCFSVKMQSRRRSQ